MTKDTPAAVRDIPTRYRHYKSFGRKHPLEKSYEKILHEDERSQLVACMVQSEIFTYESDTLGKFHVYVTGLKRALAERRIPFQMYEMDLSEEWVSNTMIHQGCEEDHISRIDTADLNHPGIAIRLDTAGSIVMVDGNHRLVRRWREGLTTFTFAAVNLPEAIEFMARNPSAFKDRAFEEQRA